MQIGQGLVDVWDEYLKENVSTYFSLRDNNPGMRMDIDYKKDLVKTFTDLDAENNEVKVTGVQKDGLGHVEKEIEYDDANGMNEYSVKSMDYDNLGRMVGLTDPDAGDEFIEVTVHDKTIKRYDKTWIVKYDNLGRTKQVLYPVTETGVFPIKRLSYDDVLNSITTVDPEGRTTIEYNDWNNNLIKVIRQGDDETESDEYQQYLYDYDALNRKIKFTDAKGIETTYAYDERDLLIKQDYGVGSDVMVYNNLGQLVKKTDRKGTVITFSYDEAGRNTLVEHYLSEDDFNDNKLDHSVRTIYDLRNNPVRVENLELIEYYEYNAAGMVTKLSRHLKNQATRELISERLGSVFGSDENELVLSFGYEYNDAGMVREMSYPDGKTHEFDYDANLGRLTDIKVMNQSFVSGIDYNLSGVVTHMEWENGVEQSWSFDNRKRISRIEINKGENELVGLDYTLNGVGDILSINDNTYSYDGFDRIVKASTLIPGQKDYYRLVTEGFGTSTSVPSLIVGGEDRLYNPDADLNTDGRII